MLYDHVTEAIDNFKEAIFCDIGDDEEGVSDIVELKIILEEILQEVKDWEIETLKIIKEEKDL